MKTNSLNFIGAALAAVLLIHPGTPAMAGTSTWNGSSSVDLNAAGNWSSLPVSGNDTWSFGATSTAGTTLNNNFSAGFAVTGLDFTATALAYTINGNAIALGGDITMAAGSPTQNINLNMNLTGVRTVNTRASGDVKLGGNLNGTGGLVKVNGGGTLWLSGTNSYSGDTTINGGAVRVGSINNNLGAGIINIGSGTTSGTLIIEGVAGETTSRTINLSGTTGSATITNNISSGTLIIASNITATGAGQKTLNLAGNKTGIVSGSIVDNSSINKTSMSVSGGSTWTLSGINTYTGNTSVSGATLVLAGTSQTKFSIGASGFNNQINGSGTLTLDGDFVFDLSGAGTTLGNNWNIVTVGTLGETFGATFAVQNFFSVNTTLWAKSIGGGNFYNFDETTGMLSVTTVPEPSTWVLLAAGATTVLILRRRTRI